MTLYFKPLCTERGSSEWDLPCEMEFKSVNKSINQIYNFTSYRKNKVERSCEQPGNFLHSLCFEHRNVFTLYA